MTTQEFVSHEAIKYKTVSPLVKQGFSNGLTKGLEIAEGLIQFALNNYFTVEALDGINYFARMSKSGSIEKLTTSELLTIFLTEKYGK